MIALHNVDRAEEAVGYESVLFVQNHLFTGSTLVVRLSLRVDEDGIFDLRAARTLI